MSFQVKPHNWLHLCYHMKHVTIHISYQIKGSETAMLQRLHHYSMKWKTLYMNPVKTLGTSYMCVTLIMPLSSEIHKFNFNSLIGTLWSIYTPSTIFAQPPYHYMHNINIIKTNGHRKVYLCPNIAPKIDKNQRPNMKEQ